jgi:hypothetical protein
MGSGALPLDSYIKITFLLTQRRMTTDWFCEQCQDVKTLSHAPHTPKCPVCQHELCPLESALDKNAKSPEPMKTPVPPRTRLSPEQGQKLFAQLKARLQ